MKEYIRNVILVMSGGHGERFGADCPKQYCVMDGRMVIDYVIDACRITKNMDQIVIVAAENYVDFISARYNLPCVAGGNSRPESVMNGIKYVHDNYNCEKLIITNAVCPLATAEQYDKYFNLLDEYDFVLTTWKLAPALQRFDGERVDRDDFFNVMEPDAYNFKMLYENFNFDNLNKYIFHNMPKDCKAYYCFDYPYTMKLTYSWDLQLIKVMYDEIVQKPNKEKTLQTVNAYLSATKENGDVGAWILKVQNYVLEIAQKYNVYSLSLNSQTEANIVYEAESHTYGSIIIKFMPSKFHFNKEYTYYKLAIPEIMADLIGCDTDYNCIILKRILPGLQVKFDAENVELREFYDKVYENLIPEEKIIEKELVPNVLSEFDEYVESAAAYTYRLEFRKLMEKKAYQVWEKYFEKAPKYYLHRDLHRRNLLLASEKVMAIDPRGAIGPKEFEFVIPFIIELRGDYKNLECRYQEMFNYFVKYSDEKTLTAALFIFWVYKMNDYTFQKKDGFKLCDWCAESIIQLFYNGNKENCLGEKLPDMLEG